MNYHWNWWIFWEPAPNGTGTYLDMLLSGLVLTIETAICAWIIALAFGSIVGVLRTLPSKTASWVGFAWVEFFRNTPLLVQLFLWFFVLPELLPPSWGLWLKQIPNAPFYTAAIGVGLFMSARVAEQLRAGIGSLPRGQKLAATAPARYLTLSDPAKRKGRIFIDYLRNGRGTTAIGAYSPRVRSGFPIAAPVTWKQVETGIRPDAFTMKHPLPR